MSSTMSRVALVLLVVALCVAIVRYVRRPRLPLPPGPKPLPIIGNTLDMPTATPWVKWREWCETYNSSLIFLKQPLQSSIIVGSYEAAIELFDKRSQIYSDRVPSVMFEMIGCDFHFSLMPYSARWRAHRRMFHQHFYSANVPKYRASQLQQIRTFLTWVLKSPEHTRKHVRHLITSIIFVVTYGKTIASMDDENVTVAHTALEGIGLACIPGIYWVEYIPWLRHIPSWFPWTVSRRLADKYYPYVMGMRDKPYAEVKAAVDNGTAPPSMSASLIEEIRTTHGKTPDEKTYDDIAKNVAGVAYAAGADTTTCACEHFLAAMAMFPEVQKTAQAVLDRVVGPNRMPDWDDIDNNQYIRALVLETLRWLPVTPFSIPHAVSEDDTYEGYHIPKGTNLIPNVWAMLRNPDDYPEPEAFKPERFLDADGNIDPNVRDPTMIAFGFGRRLCPGRHMALNSLAMFIASTLHVFDITPGVDASGKPIEIVAEIVGGLICGPKEVPTGLKPRSPTAERLIHDSLAELAQ